MDIFKFKDKSIKTKLSAIIMLTTTIALVLALSISSYSDYRSFKHFMIQNLFSIAQIVAENSTAALVFEDQQAANETLSALHAEPQIISSAILKKDGTLFATYLNQNSPNLDKLLPSYELSLLETEAVSSGTFMKRTENNLMVVSKNIILDDEFIGRLYIQYDLAELRERLENNIIILAVLLLSTFCIAYVISMRLQKVISQPILSLANTMRNISRKQDYTVQVKKESQDEIGILIDEFNVMLAKINYKDKTLDKIVIDLREAKETTDSISQVKSRFLANMNHELRTPLNAIVGYCDLLIDEFSDEGHDHAVSDLYKIKTSGNNLLTMIKNVLDFTKIEAGNIELFQSGFDIQSLINEVTHELSPLMTKNANNLNVEIPDNIGNMITDKNRLRQCLLNLLSNAAKFTRNGTVTLSAKRYIKASEDWISFDIADTGIGIDENQFKSIFQKFSQVDVSSARKYEGAGLGLAISQQICRLMGGDIFVKSKLRIGSTFSLKLPAVMPLIPSRVDMKMF